VTSRPSAEPWRKHRGRLLPPLVRAASLVAAKRLVGLQRGLARRKGLALDELLEVDLQRKRPR